MTTFATVAGLFMFVIGFNLSVVNYYIQRRHTWVVSLGISLTITGVIAMFSGA